MNPHHHFYPASLIALLGLSAQAQPISSPEGSWENLTDQPSRRELFAEHIASQIRSKPPEGPASAFPLLFEFPQDVIYDYNANHEKRRRQNAIFGIDISHHEGTNLKLDELRGVKVDFVYAKATQGIGFKDPRFGDYWKALGQLPSDKRLLRGAYHFLSAADDGTKQAERFVEFVKLHGGFQKGDMPPCLDLEWDVVKSSDTDKWKGQSPKKILKSVTNWLEKTKELTGRTPVVYTARSWWKERQIPETSFSQLNDYPIWIADYSQSHKAMEKPAIINKRAQTLWQFADDARLARGYGGTLDANVFYGTQDDFKKAFGLGR